MKKIVVLLLTILLLTSCANNSHNNSAEGNTTDDTKEAQNSEEKKEEKQKENEDPSKSTIRYTGEVITNGGFSEGNYISFVPDQETKKLLSENYDVDTSEESLYVEIHDNNTVVDIPIELGIYKAEIKFAEDLDGHYLVATSIKLTDNIGTVEYQGKAYETNVLDENVRVKDTVCGLIVKYISHTSDIGLAVRFAGYLEVEGYYELYNGGEYHNYKNIGMIHATNESLKNVPVYKDYPIKNNVCTIYFAETNDLYKALSDNSQIGKGTFKIDNYFIEYETCRSFSPIETLVEIVNVNHNYNKFFSSEKALSQICQSTDNYYLIQSVPKTSDTIINADNATDISNIFIEAANIDYYIIDKKTDEIVKILSSNGYKYEYNFISDERISDKQMFTMTSDGYNFITNKLLSPHTASFKFISYESTIEKTLDYANFNDSTSDSGTTMICTGDQFMGMTAEKIKADYFCYPLTNCKNNDTDNNIDNYIIAEELVHLNCDFKCSDELKLTGTLRSGISPDFGFYAYFILDDDSKGLLPHGTLDERDGSSFHLTEENVRELLGSEADNSIEKRCNITISNYSIGYRSGTSCYDFATVTNIEFLE